jgi:hypothetical protein
MLKFWGRKEVAEYLDVKTDSINGYNLPAPDAQIGIHRGWMPDTIRKWEINRPGKGKWDKPTRVEQVEDV